MGLKSTPVSFLLLNQSGKQIPVRTSPVQLNQQGNDVDRRLSPIRMDERLSSHQSRHLQKATLGIGRDAV